MSDLIAQASTSVLLTGRSGGIGSAIAELLELNGYRIIPLTSRLENFSGVEEEVRQILASTDIRVLINCAGYGVFRPLEDIPTKVIGNLVQVNLTAPMVICRTCLPTLKKNGGHIINIASIEATRHSRHSSIYTAAKSGLRDFSLSLFEEVRKSGVRVSCINPDITDTAFFDNLSFEPSRDPNCFLTPKDLAQAVLTVLNSGGAISDLTIRPQKAGIHTKGARPR